MGGLSKRAKNKKWKLTKKKGKCQLTTQSLKDAGDEIPKWKRAVLGGRARTVNQRRGQWGHWLWKSCAALTACQISAHWFSAWLRGPPAQAFAGCQTRAVCLLWQCDCCKRILQKYNGPHCIWSTSWTKNETKKETLFLSNLTDHSTNKRAFMGRI